MSWTTVTQTTFCDKNESHPLFHKSVLKQLTTVKLDFDQIRTMTCVFSGFRCSLLSLVLFVAIQALAKPENNANSTPVSSSATKHCNNVYNSFYAGPNKKIETILQEIKKQLTQLQDDINISKGNKTTVKGKIRFFAELWILLIFQKYFIRCPSTTIWNPLFLQEYPTKPLHKKTALRAIVDLAGKRKTLRVSWLEYDYNRVWLTEKWKTLCLAD